MTKLELIKRKLQLKFTPAEAVINQIAQKRIQFTDAITLTFPNEPYDHIQGERIFGVFMHYLNERCYRRSYKRKEKRLSVFAVQEGQQTYRRRHFHCAIKRPGRLSEDEFSERITKCWVKATKNRYAIVDIRDYNDSGWLDYITKEVKQSDTTSISEHCYW